ncbi:MAG: aminotransferase class IV [Deltaproteobacteria bacterium]|jgi:branched-chain amino acid aminotransferase|nr:aminotransferase class IV [Deltaproteobacteria bacterium]
MSQQWPAFSPQELARTLLAGDRPWLKDLYVMFSSYWGGFSQDPALWGVPPDDHMVHRGDAVFESLKCADGRVYCLPEHMERMRFSAKGLELQLPKEFDDLLDIIRQARALDGRDDFTIRVTVSRGPGSFSVNPYDSVGGSQLYVVTYKLKTPSEEQYEKGVTLATAPFPAKDEYAVIKSCDYLHNVLAKKSAVDAGAQYVVSFDREGYLTEGATENVVVVTKDGDLCAPSFSRILKGVTLTRVMDIARELVAEGTLRSVGNRDMTEKEAKSEAGEVFLATTSFGVLGVSHWDNEPVGEGKAGPISLELLKRLEKDVRSNGPHNTSLK